MNSVSVSSSSNHGRRLRVLVGAYACDPKRGSEFGVGWGWVKAISDYHDLTVIAGVHQKKNIESELAQNPELASRLEFYYVRETGMEKVERFWPPAHIFTYEHRTQREMYAVAKRLHAARPFDLAHQLTYVGFRVPGHLWKLGIPFVWGPVGGLEQTTWSLLPPLGWRGVLHFTGRNFFNAFDRHFAIAPKRAFAKAQGGIIAATSGIQKAIRDLYGCDSEVMCEIGIPPQTQATPLRRAPQEPLRLIWCGHLIPRKALPFLIDALALLPRDLNWQLDVVGDGPCAQTWKERAQQKNISGRIHWLGKVPRSTVLDTMQKAHALAVTSVYDLTSTVVVEAFANGIPVVCPAHCGFIDAVTPEAGITVPADNPSHLVAGLRDAIVRLFNEDLRIQLANGAVARSQNYQWDEKALLVDAIYRRKMAESHA